MVIKRSVALALTVCCVACGPDTPQLQPIIEVPPPSSDAYPYEGLDEIELSIARAGDDRDLVSATFLTGEQIILQDVPLAADLVVHLRGLDDGAEIAYGRTCAIDLGDDDMPDPHIHFARIVKWAPGAPMTNAARIDGLVFSTDDARNAVFVNGGAGITTIERFDALTGQFIELDARTIDRKGAMVATFANGTALVVGGIVGEPPEAVTTSEVIDPLANPGFQIDVQAGPGVVDGRAISLVDGSVLVSGGDLQPGPGQAFSLSASGWLFKLGAGDALDPPRELVSTLTTARRLHAVTRLSDELGGDVLITGGQDATGVALGSAELYRPLGEVFEPVVGAAMSTPRWGHAAVRMPGGFVLLIGGLADNPVPGDPLPVTKLELYDPVQGRFSDATDLPAGAGVSQFSITELPDGRYLLAGGVDATGTTTVATSYIVQRDPITGLVNISRTDDLATPRAGHTAKLLCDGTVLLVGGTDEPLPPERYNPVELGRR